MTQHQSRTQAYEFAGTDRISRGLRHLFLQGQFLRFLRFDFVLRFFRPQNPTPIMTMTTPTTIGRIAPIEALPPIAAPPPTVSWWAKAGEEVTKIAPTLIISQLQPTTLVAKVVVRLRSTFSSLT